MTKIGLIFEKLRGSKIEVIKKYKFVRLIQNLLKKVIFRQINSILDIEK